MKKWSKYWKKSKNPKKQRKYLANAPIHIKSKMLKSHLSKELRKKYARRNMRIRIGDKVKIMKGSFKGKISTIEKIDVKKSKVYIRGAETTRKDGRKAMYPIHTSNIEIQELILDDKKRIVEVKLSAAQQTSKKDFEVK